MQGKAPGSCPALLIYHAENGHLPWNIRDLSVPAVCPTSGWDYLFTPGEWFLLEFTDPQTLAKFRDIVDNQINWNRIPIVSCQWHLDTSRVDGWWWDDVVNDWRPIEFDDTNEPGGTLAVTLEPRVGYMMVVDPDADQLLNQFYTSEVRPRQPSSQSQ